MSKRARADPESKTVMVAVPEWATQSGLFADDLQTFFALLQKEGYVVADNTEMRCTCGLALPTIATGYKGRTERIYCNSCVEHCECCGTACDDFYDNDDLESPHSQLCYKCHMGDGPRCTCKMPETCPCCGRGVRFTTDYTDKGFIIGFHQIRCMYCEDDDCMHTA